jgi:beta-lactamase class A
VRRIAGRLPQGVSVADKTGSAAGTANDAGLVTLPATEREDIIANIARTIYDYFVITAA